jgi:hypothetical protein
MDATWNAATWRQFGAAIDMLERAVRACPGSLWSDRSRSPEFWYLAFHTLFWLDLYLSDSIEGFSPPAPFGLEELDPAGRLPERPYTKEELLAYLEHGRARCRAAIEALIPERAAERRRFASVEGTAAELLLYNLRHVQHHAAQLHLILRRETDSTPGWVTQAGEGRRSGADVAARAPDAALPLSEMNEPHGGGAASTCI